MAILLTMLITSTAVAQEEPTFEELIGDAKTAYDAEDYQKAIDLLLYAHRVQPNARLLINVAKSYERMDECAPALVYYRAYLREDDTEDNLIEVAENAVADADMCPAFDPSMAGRLIIKSNPLDAKISVDGQEVGTTPFEIPGLEAGDHEVVLTLDGYEPFETTVTMRSDSDETVSTTLVEEKPEPVVTAPEPTPDPDPVVKEKPGLDPMVYVAGGVTAVGVGLLVMGLVMDLSAIPATDDERDQAATQAEYDRLTDQRNNQANLALIGYVGGSLLAIGGGAWLAYMLFLDEPADGASVELGEGVDLRPVVRHDGGGVILEGRF